MSDPDAPARSTILLVEDEPAVRRSLQLLLQGHGFDVRTHGSRQTAVADPMAAAASAIVTDFRLPDGDGIELLACIRGLGFAGAAILVTAFGSTELAQRAREAGFDRVLEKPLADRVLTVALDQAIA